MNTNLVSQNLSFRGQLHFRGQPQAAVQPQFKAQQAGAEQQVFNTFINSSKKRHVNFLSNYVQPKHPGPIQGTKNFIAGIKKAWINVAEYTKGTVIGVLGGSILGGLTYGVLHGIKAVKSLLKKNKDQIVYDIDGILTKRAKRFKLLAETVSIAVGLATLGYSLFKSSLNVSERTADVDHRYNTGHRFEP